MNINATLIGQLIAFAVFVWFCMKYVWPSVVTVMSQREQRIEAGLVAAEQAAEQLQQAGATKKEIIEETKKEVVAIINQANKRRDSIIDEAHNKAIKERELILQGAEAEMHRRQQKVREQLRSNVAELAVIAAEKILEKEIDKDKHRQLLQEVAAKL